MVARIFNVVLSAMNTRVILPKYLVVVPDKDILDATGFADFGERSCLKGIVKYLVKEINKYVDARFEDLYRKKSGSVKKGEPRVIWVKMIDRPTLKNDPIMSWRSTFNEILEEVLVAEGHTYIINLTSLKNDKFFSSGGELLADGRIQFWKELDHVLKEFDRKKITLLPHDTNASAAALPKASKKFSPKAPVPINDRYHVDHRPNRGRPKENVHEYQQQGQYMQPVRQQYPQQNYNTSTSGQGDYHPQKDYNTTANYDYDYNYYNNY